ncbi:hypothetical protein ASG49_06585 [Marmoricola sp. Leaf446]|uniref:hypothetical protein n=1 Tax=Marmoricola sp. Leaf446 TaxID=1736379 RepID=UPI0007005276|nr:hypothetical protein [Marmoricola sp. Leaf446]KQT94523.1 hypothetical protein ASG49_06585 [Marmoricola sp. Leaf446]
MDSPLTLGLALALGAALVAVVVLAVQVRRARRSTEAELLATRAESEALRERVDGLAARLDRRDDGVRSTADGAAYVITDAGAHEPAPLVDARPMVADRVVLNAALGEPLVRAVALGHGVRRALGAESRNRIRFEMRREAKRARKQRRREMRDAYREARVARRPPEGPGARAA